MVNINTSGAQSGRDFSYGASPVYPETFLDMYYEILSKVDMLSLIEDETTFKIELNKIRKKMKRLIMDHFNPSLSQLKNQDQFKAVAFEQEKQLKHIKEVLSI